MAKYYFEYKTTPYLFDTKQFKLFRLENKIQVEIIDPAILRCIRLNSTEIDIGQAIILAKGNSYSKSISL